MEIPTKEGQVLQWHPGFYAGIQVEFAEERQKLQFENEHQLGTKPKEIDVLIIKKNAEDVIEKNIGRIFREHNIIEYKSPEDSLSVDDFHRVCGYAHFYKADTPKEDMIKLDEITISFACNRYPRKLLRHIKDDLGYEIRKVEDGICYITGGVFRMQLILLSRLSKMKNFWLRNLTNDLRKPEDIALVSVEYQKHRGDKLYESVMNLIIRANRKNFEQEGKIMCEAIIELFQDEWNEKESVWLAKEEAWSVKEEAWNVERKNTIQRIMKNLQMTATQAMDVLEIPVEERAEYLQLLR